MKTFIKLFSACVLISFVGCSFSSDGMVDVEGTVTYENKPLEEGRILMRLMQQDRKAYFAKINSGTFELRVPEGPYRVEIRASRPIPGKFDRSNGTPKQMGEMYIPAKYNRETELEATVAADGSNRLAFDLAAK